MRRALPADIELARALLQMMRMKKTISVGELMSKKVYALRESDTLERLRDCMHDAEIRHVPIVDELGCLTGIVSQRDLHRAPTGMARISDIMIRNVSTVKPTTPAANAVATLIQQRIGALPVVDDSDRLVGMISATDFLQVAEEALAGPGPRGRVQVL